MKKIYLLQLAAAIAVAAFGCGDDPEPLVVDDPISPSSFKISSEDAAVTIDEQNGTGTIAFRSGGGNAFIYVETDIAEWNVSEGTQQWLDIVKSYEGVMITAQANDLRERRTDEFTISAKGNTAEVSYKFTVTQNAHGGLDLEIGDYDILMTAGGNIPQQIEIGTDNEDWSFELSCPWLLAEKIGNFLKFTADPNPDPEARSTSVDVVLTYGGERVSETITVAQEAKSVIKLSRSSVSLGFDGGEVTFTVTTNQPEWTFEKPDGAGVDITRDGDDITVKAGTYSGSEDRWLPISIMAGGEDNETTENFYISQLGSDPAKMAFKMQTSFTGMEVTLPLDGDVECVVNWGDGTIEHVFTPYPTHRYELAEPYYVTVEGKVTALNSEVLSTGHASYIREIIRWGKTGLTSMSGGLYYCSNITYLPDDTEGSFAEVTTFDYAFSGCSKLEEIPAGIFKNAAKAENFERVFYNSSMIDKIPSGLFDNCKAAKSFRRAFMSTKVTEIPAGLFDKNTDAEDFYGVFESLKITNIPSGIFAKNTKATDFSYVFYKTGITSIPSGLFDNNTNAELFGYTFAGTAITQIPAGLFDKTTKATHFAYTFNDCKQLEAIPAGLFKNCTEAISFYATFYNCESIKTIPGDIFNAPKAEETKWIFRGCEGLETIGEGLLDSFTSTTSFSMIFNSCGSLKAIPENLFAKNTEVTDMGSLFWFCTSLTSIPRGLFDNNKKVTYFGSAFSYCWDIEGESPYSIIDGKKVHLYERYDYPEIFANPGTGTGCFSFCSGLEDYADMPSSWK